AALARRRLDPPAQAGRLVHEEAVRGAPGREHLPGRSREPAVEPGDVGARAQLEPELDPPPRVLVAPPRLAAGGREPRGPVAEPRIGVPVMVAAQRIRPARPGRLLQRLVSHRASPWLSRAPL